MLQYIQWPIQQHNNYEIQVNDAHLIIFVAFDSSYIFTSFYFRKYHNVLQYLKICVECMKWCCIVAHKSLSKFILK